MKRTQTLLLAIAVAINCAPTFAQHGHAGGMGNNATGGMGHGESVSLGGAELCFAMVFGFVLATRQLSQRSPMLPIDLMRIRLFALSVATSICRSWRFWLFACEQSIMSLAARPAAASSPQVASTLAAS